ncbi:hypothetical protein [Streptomyces hilarionis]|uniref:hypothetical protein n=1 Tax=Streptomyces hilarionis TaxID=2839954 RepID=UPI00211A3804|nr:hypothetical protein [Streptomyces hilarionis]MCQ9131738.1 hypothetical protein [Streptomyces hilarionis]
MSIGHTLSGPLDAGPHHGRDVERATAETSDRAAAPRPGPLDEVRTADKHPRRTRTFTHRRRGGVLADRLIRDHAPCPPEVGPRRPGPTAARPDRLREAVTR